MERTLLVPLDGSPLSESILPHAALLAQATGTRLVLMRVAAPSPEAAPPADGDRPSQGAGAETVAQAAAYLQTVAQHPTIKALVAGTLATEGPAARAILAYAAEHDDVATIAMATHGRHGLTRFVCGSVTQTVLQGATVPLLVVRPPEAACALPAPAPRPYRTILVPLDGGPVAEQALAPAQTLAAAPNVTLLLLSVLPQARHLDKAGDLLGADYRRATRMQEYQARLARELEGAGLRVAPRLLTGNPAARILAIGDYARVDLIVMATHRRDGWQRLRMGSVALRVAQAAHCPLLLLRAQPQPAPVREHAWAGTTS